MSFLQFTKDDIMRAIELAVMALLGLIVVLFVVRPLVRRILTPESAAAGRRRGAAGRRRRRRRRGRPRDAPMHAVRPARPPR